MAENINPVQLQKYLGDVDYPASKDEIIQKAKENGADENVITHLEQLPDNQEFETPADVNKNINF